MDFSKTHKIVRSDKRISEIQEEREMKTNNIGNIRHPINFRKLAKPAGL